MEFHPASLSEGWVWGQSPEWFVWKCAETSKEWKRNGRMDRWIYPTLGCDTQGFRAMGLSFQYWPRWFQDFPAIWLAVRFGANGAHLGICTLPEKNNCVWNKLFLCEIKFSQRGTRPGKSLWWQIVPMQESTNEWKNLTIFQIMGLVVHNGKTSNSEVPIDKINIEIL